MTRKKWKRIGLVSGIVVLVILLVIALLQSRFVKQKILSSLQSSLHKSQGIHLTVRSFDYNLLKLRFALKGIQIQMSGKPDLPPVFRAEEIRVNIPLSLLIRRRLRIQDVVIVDPKILIQIDRNGDSNLPFRSGAERSPQAQTVIPDFLIEHLEVTNAQLDFMDQRNQLAVGLSDIWIEGEGKDFGTHSLLLEMRREGSVRFRDRSFPFEKCVVQAGLSGGGVSIERLSLALAHNDVELSGRIGDLSSLILNGDLQGNLDLDNLRALVADDNPVSGKIRFHADLRGSLKELEARIGMQSEDLKYGTIGEIGLSAELSWKERLLEILSIDLSVGKGQIHGKGILNPLEWKKGNHLELNWKGIDLETFRGYIPGPVYFSARTEGTLNASWDGFSYDNFRGECDVRFVPTLDRKDLGEGTPLKGRLIASADSGRVEITRLDISAADTDLGGRLLLLSDNLSGEFKIKVRRIERAIPLILAFAGNLEEKDVQDLGLGGQVSVSARLGGNLKQPNIGIDVKSENLEVLKMKNLKVEGSALYDSRSLRVRSLLIEEDEGRIQASGIFPLKPAGQNMRFAIEGEGLSVEKILLTLGQEPSARGIIQVKAELEGTPAAPKLKSKWVVSDLSFYEENLGRMEASAEYKDSKIVFDSLRIAKSKGSLDAGGFYDLESRDFLIRLSVKSFPLGGLRAAANLESIKAELDLDLEGSGNLDEPHFKTKGSIRRFSLGERNLPDMRFVAQSEKGTIQYKIEAPEFSSSLDGMVSLGLPRILSAHLAIDKLHLEDVKDKVLLFDNYDLSGSVKADAYLAMDLGDPRKTLSCNISLEEIQLRSGEHLIRSEGPILLSIGPEEIRVERLFLSGKGSRLRAEGSLPIHAPSSAKILLSAEVDLSILNDLFSIQGYDGTMKVESEISGSLSDLEAKASIDLGEVRFQPPQFPHAIEVVQGSLKIEKNILHIDSFFGRIDKIRFGLKGDIPFASLPFQLPVKLRVFEERKATLALDFADVDPSSFKSLVPMEMLDQLRGTIGGRIELEGESLRLEDLSGFCRFDTIALDLRGVSIKQESISHIFLEKGRLAIEALSFQGGENRLDVSGTANLLEEQELNLSLDGQIDLGLLGIFHREGLFSGKTGFRVRIVNSLQSPEIEGFMNIQDGRYQRAFPRVLLEQLNGEVKFQAGNVEIPKIQGVLNGGIASLDGKISLDGLGLRGAEIALKNEDSLFDYPPGLSSQITGDLKFLSDGKDHRITGTATILDARYEDDFRVGTAVYNLLKRGSMREPLQEPIPFLKNLSLDVDIVADNSLIVDNNIAKAEISADLKLIGSPYIPSVAGRASVSEGGKVFFNQNTFVIEQATVDFVNPVRIEPDLNLDARTQVQEFDIQLIVQGTPEKLTATLLSDPPLSEPNIISLLVTGRTLDSASAQMLSVAGHTALSYLDNAITGRVGQATARALGLDSVRIDAGLVSSEENPEARLTVGQHLLRNFELVFSQDLKDARNQMWIVNYNPYKSFNIQGIKRDNNEFNLALRHEVQFGLKAASRKIPLEGPGKRSLVLGDVRLEGEMGLPESVIYQKLKLRKGSNVDFAGLQEAFARVRKLYQKENYLSYSLVVRREKVNGRLDLNLKIESGPKIFLQYEGDPIPRKLKKEILATWVGNPFGQLALGDIEQRIRTHFMEKRYFDVRVGSKQREQSKDFRVLTFHTTKGRRYKKPVVRIIGNRALSEKIIASHLKNTGVMNRVFYSPADFVKSIEDLYLRKGFLRPEVQLPVVHREPDEKNAIVEISVEEGMRYTVENIKTQGLEFFGGDQILGEIGIYPGNFVSPEQLYQADTKIREMYVQKGFNDARVQSNVQAYVEKGTIDLNIDIQENQKGIIAEIAIDGNVMTNEMVIRRELKFHTEDVLNFRMINETRKRLYDLGIFGRVNIDIIPLALEDKYPAEKHFRVVVSVAELKPYRLRYGFQYDTESSFGVLANLINRNLFGRSNLLGGSFRLNRDERDVRAFFRSPYFFSKKIGTEIFVFDNRTKKPAFTIERTGFTLQQQMKIKESDVISYNYTFENIDTSYPVLEGIQNVDTADRIGTLNVAFVRDTRNDILNASRGLFLSQNIRYAPGILGSRAQFIRYFGQFNTYRKISDFLTYAASIRLGLGKGFDEGLPASERFFAGGGTTVRGFKKDELGPKDPSSGLPLGGDAVFILNQELRFPILKKFGGVVFLDVGNVYPKVSDFSFSDIRKTAGFGFRLHTPFILVRFDWGFKLDRRPGETASQLFFSIGQAF